MSFSSQLESDTIRRAEELCGCLWKIFSYGFGPVGISQEQLVFIALVTGVNECFCIQARESSRTLHSTVPLFHCSTVPLCTFLAANLTDLILPLHCCVSECVRLSPWQHAFCVRLAVMDLLAAAASE